jgi:3-hydroxybutyrate dehydrogenase
MIGLTKTTALETAEDAITVNVICSGYVLTAIVKGKFLVQCKIMI